jgi:lipoprotein NlpI
MKLIYGLSAILFGTATTIALVPRYVVAFTPQEGKTVAPSRPVLAAMSATQVGNIARQVTVLINGQNPGSGVIIRRSGNTYTVLTARHVVATPDEYDIITPDGQKFRLNYATVKPLPGVDLATLEFTSSANYQVAKLGNSRSAPSGTTVYVAGFPVPTAAINQSIFNFTEGKITANADRPLADGYALVYSNNTLPGMSGGPVLNDAGEVIGVHGKGDTDTTSAKVTANPNVALKTGFNLAIPINTFLTLAVRTGVVGFAAPASAPVSTQPTADDLYLQALNKLRNFDYKGAIADFDQMIRLNPNSTAAYLNRASAKISLKDNAGACADLDRSLQLNPIDALAYLLRAECRLMLGNQQGARQDMDQAFRFSLNRAQPNLDRGITRVQVPGRGTVYDYDQAIRLNPNDHIAYYHRGNARFDLKNYQGAVSDYSQAISFRDTFAYAYYNRGVARENLGDPEGAASDYKEVADTMGLIGDAGNKMMLARAKANLKRLESQGITPKPFSPSRK